MICIVIPPTGKNCYREEYYLINSYLLTSCIKNCRGNNKQKGVITA